MHLTIQDQWPAGGCGKGNDNKSHGSDDPHHADAQYHFKVSVASVKPGHEDLAPPVQLGGEEDETPKRLADCKGYFILCPKGLLRVESAVVMTTPRTTHPHEGMNTTTPPPQLLAPPVMLGESGERCEEGGPSRVDRDFAPVLQQAMDDVMDEDDDPMQFLNTAFINNQELDMMSQPYDSANKEHMDEEMDILPEQEHPRSECKKSLFMQPLQDTPPDAASNQHEQPLLSPSTLGLAIKGAMKGSSQPLPQKEPRKRPNRKDLSAKKAVNAETAREHIRGSQETARPCTVDREKPSRVEGSRISTLCGACASGHGLRRHVACGSVLPAV